MFFYALYDKKLDCFVHSCSGKWLYQKRGFLVSMILKLESFDKKYHNFTENRYEIKKFQLVEDNEETK